MQLKDYLTGEMENVQRLLGLALQDLDDEVANWQPGGTANSIASTLAHVTNTQDHSINVRLLGGQTVFESGGWPAKTGIPIDAEKIWDEGWRLNLDAFAEYQAALAESMGRFMDALTESTLTRRSPTLRDLAQRHGCCETSSSIIRSTTAVRSSRSRA